MNSMIGKTFRDVFKNHKNYEYIMYSDKIPVGTPSGFIFGENPINNKIGKTKSKGSKLVLIYFNISI